MALGLSDYLNYKFYERTAKERRKYVTIKYASKFYAEYSPKEAATNLRIKPKFHEHYGKYTRRDYFIHEHGIDFDITSEYSYGYSLKWL